MKKIILLFAIIISSFGSFGSVVRQKNITIGIIAIGDISNNEIKIVAHSIKAYYKFSIKFIEKTEFLKTDKKYASDSVFAKDGIEFISKIKSERAELNFLIGITDRPIMIVQNGKIKVIRGMTNKENVIISTFKIKKESVNSTKYKQHLSKVALHECGHLLGLVHCTNSCKCFMIGWNTCIDCDECFKITDMDDASKFYNTDNKMCDKCKKAVELKISELLKDH